jgi:hypothetical protein
MTRSTWAWVASALVALALAAPVSAQTSDASSGASTSASSGTASGTTSDATGSGSGSVSVTTTPHPSSSSSGSGTSTGTTSSTTSAPSSTGTASTTATHGGATGTGATGTGATGTGATGTGATGTGAAAPPAREREEDDGRDVDFLWIEAEGGISTVDLIAFSGNNNFAPGDPAFRETSGVGPYGALGLGFRVYWFALGARGTFAGYSGFQIGTVGGDAQLRIPVWIFDLYVRAGAGYAWQGDASYSGMGTAVGSVSVNSTTVWGWSFDAAAGLDIFLANWITLGAGIALDVLNMTRHGNPDATVTDPLRFNPQQNGDAVGYQLRGFAQLGLHF